MVSHHARLTEPIVRTGGLPVEVVRSNPNITKVVHFANFAGDYLVGVSVATHPHGEECGTHNHRGAHEFFYVIEGCGIIVVDGVENIVKRGDSVLVPVGSSHNLIGQDMFRVLCGFVVAPGHENDPTPWKPVEPE